MRRLATATAFALALLPSAAPAAELDIERIFAEPPLDGRLPEGEAFAPEGGALAWMVRATRDGAPSLWMRDPVSGEVSLRLGAGDLPGPSDEEPGRLAAFRWSPDGRSFLLTSAEGDLYLLPVDGELRRLTATEGVEADAKLSPDGTRVAFVRDHDLHVLDLASGEERALTRGGSEDLLHGETDWVTCEELDLCTGYWWSPDSSTLAVLRFDQSAVLRYPIVDWSPLEPTLRWQRYPKAGTTNAAVSLGVVPASGGEVHWLETGAARADYLARVDWLPDGKALLVHRLDRRQETLSLDRLDPAGESAPANLLTERDETWVNLPGETLLLSDGRILTSSERDGWRHLYLHAADGNLLRRLTEGPWEVTALEAVDEEKGLVYFTATEASVLERHLYRVSLEGGEPERLSRAPGTHEVTFAPSADLYLDRYSRASRPPGLSLHAASGDRLAEIVPAQVERLAPYPLPVHEFVEVPARDGTILRGRLQRPAAMEAGRRYPVIVYVYGGPHAQVARDLWERTRALWSAMMVQKGYLVFSVDNRGSFGRGREFERAVDRRLGQLELSDQLAGVEWLRTLRFVDPGRIGIWGGSYGGYMTLYAMTHAPGVFRAGAAVAPVTDWTLYDTIYTERYMETPKANPEGYRAGSPLARAADLRGALLLAHGTADDNVHMQNTLRFLGALTEAGLPYALQIHPGESHGFQGADARRELYAALARFFLERL